MTKSEKYERAAEVYKVLANAKRLQIIHALDGKELSVEELTKLLKVRKPNISQHLSILRRANLVKKERHTTNVYYKMADPGILRSCAIIQGFSKKLR